MKTIFKVFFYVWTFWALICSSNFNFLGGPFFPFLVGHYAAYHTFLMIPVSLATVTTTILLLIFGKHLKPSFVVVSIINTLFLCVLIFAAEIHKNIIITNAAETLGYDRFVQQSFWRSILYSGNDLQHCLHAIVCKNQETWIWSYREMGFFPIPETISRNVGICYQPNIICADEPKL